MILLLGGILLEPLDAFDFFLGQVWLKGPVIGLAVAIERLLHLT